MMRRNKVAVEGSAVAASTSCWDKWTAEDSGKWLQFLKQTLSDFEIARLLHSPKPYFTVIFPTSYKLLLYLAFYLDKFIHMGHVTFMLRIVDLDSRNNGIGTLNLHLELILE